MYKHKILSLLVILALFALPTLGFAQDDEETPEATEETPSEENIPEGFEVITTEDELFSIIIPEGWIIQSAQDSIAIASDEELLGGISDPSIIINEDEGAIQLVYIPFEFVPQLGIESTDLMDIAPAFIGQLLPQADTDNPNNLALSPPELIEEDDSIFDQSYVISEATADTFSGALVFHTLTEELLAISVVIAPADADEDVLQNLLTTVFSWTLEGSLDELLGR